MSERRSRWQRSGRAPTRRNDGGPRRLGPSLDHLLGTMDAPPADVLTTVFGEWESIVGADVAAHSRPSAMDGTCLVVTCDSPAWASEVRWLEQQLLDRLADVSGSNRIETLAVRVARQDRS